MNKKLALVLLSSPTVLGSMLSMLLTVNPAHATEPVASVTDSCRSLPDPHISRLTCARFSQTTQIASAGDDYTGVQTLSDAPSSSEPPMLNFTEEESEAAVQLFGCDCVVCIDAIRQMRGLAPIS